jgi:hypothetical protein
MYEIHIDEEITNVKKRLKELEEHRELLVSSIKKYVLYKQQPTLHDQLLAAICYRLEIVPTVMDTDIKMKMIEGKGIAVVDLKKSEIGHPSYVGHVRSMILHTGIWKDMWRDAVNRGKIEMSYLEWLKDIQQHRDVALMALLDQYYGERYAEISSEELGLDNIIILMLGNAKIFERD